VNKPAEDLSTRDRIGVVALALFAESGYQGTPVREIAEAIGVTTPALYYHFDTKEDVLAACVDPYLGAVDALLDEWGDRTVPDSELSRFVEEYLALLLDHREIVRFLHRDLAAARTGSIGVRLAAQREATLRRLGGDPQDQASWVRVTSVMGALRNPVIMIDGDLDEHRDQVVADAMQILRQE
jgi:AcrR family transcriptional regulator